MCNVYPEIYTPHYAACTNIRVTPQALAHYSAETAGKEIWVIGSGKTAMDVMSHLARKDPSTAARLRCVSGRGTWFINRG